jgi:glycyl-tRNA synthetase beta chain
MPDFLLEIGLEEVPARMIASAQAELLKRTLALLTREKLISADQTAHAYSTPRRLAVLVRNVLTQQPDITEETTGPAVKIAFKDGQPTPAAEAFARKSGIAVADLRTITTPKGDYLAATTLKRGRTATEVLAAELPKEIAALYWAKNMRWIPGSNEKFVRPVLWLLCLLGEEIVPVTFAGRIAGRATYGHRVLSTGEPFEIVTPDSYLAQLEGEYVLADVEPRRQKIRKALDKVTREIPNARWREDEALVDSVTHLTEWPDVLLGNFEPAYLTLPEEVLVTVMRDHQKYFAVEIADTPGAPHLASEMWETKNPLAPHFLTVTNIALTGENTPIIRQGNERVLRARFNDARFFWEFDQRTPLAARVALLENVTFQKDLGTYADKSKRVTVIAQRLTQLAVAKGIAIDASAVSDAASLAKADLTSELVKEFTELQGIVGGLYARHEGLSNTVADAIYDQYLPASSDDPIPRSREGAILGLADRIDTLVKMFDLGFVPTGSKDPFALRRAANAIVRILAEANLPLVLSDVIHLAHPPIQVAEPLRKFFMERIDFYLREVRGHAYDVVKAVMADMTNEANDLANDLYDLVVRAEAVTAMRGSEDFLAVCASFKRIKNIVAQAEAAGFLSMTVQQYPTQPITQHPAQIALNNAVFQVSQSFADFCAARQYTDALKLLATLRPQVDAFLDPKTGVRVMDDEPYTRETRLNLLQQILKNFSSIADFSEIVTAG